MKSQNPRVEHKRMSDKKLQHINRRLSAEERTRHTQTRDAAARDFPPKPGAGRKASPPGIPAQIRQAREARGLTWYALAKLAGVPNQATVRDIEQGKDVKLSNLQAVAVALGLKLHLVEEAA
jgi:DNA-binding XRE family transcriptional regulator